MAYLCADKRGEYIANDVPARDFRDEWNGWEDFYTRCTIISIPKGTIKKLIGRELTVEDEPVEI